MEMQALWQAEVDWEEEPPPTVRSKWIELFKEMKEPIKIMNEVCAVRMQPNRQCCAYFRMRLKMPLELALTSAREQTITCTMSD